MNLDKYGIRIIRTLSQEPAWRLVRIEKLTGAQNQGNHHVYINAYKTDGARAVNAKAVSHGVLIPLDKPDTIMEKGHGNIPMWGDAIGVEMYGGLSDAVEGLSTRHPDEEPGNTWGHHSFRLDFQWKAGDAVKPTIDPDEMQIDLALRVEALEADLEDLRVLLAQWIGD